jgi:hypothetical protein
MFDLDDQPGSKPVASSDDLLKVLIHHWAVDESVFPTEDDRLDLATIILFQAYTGCRPAELVDGTKTQGRGDPLRESTDSGFITAGDRPRPDSGPEHGDEIGGDDTMSIDEESDAADPFDDFDFFEELFGDDGFDDGFDSDATDDTEISEADPAAFDDPGKQNPPPGLCDGGPENDPVRRYKSLCYEDLVLWIVKDPIGGGRDVLAMEVIFKHHKGVDRKPKPYVQSLSDRTMSRGCVANQHLQDDILVSRACPSYSLPDYPHPSEGPKGSRH